MNKQAATEYLEDSQHHLKMAINSLYLAMQELEGLQSDDEWDLSADIETQIITLKNISRIIN